MIKRALVLQHMDDEPPGLFGEFLAADGVATDVVMLHQGAVIPSLRPYDFLLVMGGAMDVWESETNPWLAAEKEAIREWALARNRPFLGICLGLQLLAEALGGTVAPARAAEVGIGRVTLNGLGLQHPLTAGLGSQIKVMQWHRAEVKLLPAGAEVLASSEICPVQIMAVGRELLATQFHAELDPALVARWADLPQYIAWLDEALGDGAYPRIAAQALPLMPQWRRTARALYDNVTRGKRQRLAA
jgi:GMP synthase-like glutamine amidotransferase